MTSQQASTHIVYDNRSLHPAQTRTEVRQILYNGAPAVEVKVWEIPSYREGEKEPVGHMVRHHMRRFATPKPVTLFGMPVVGQWKDTELNRFRGAVMDNPDASTHVDYQAWIDAFALVYGES